MRLPWWAYCAPQFAQDRGFRGPPGGGTRYYNDPVSGQKYKTCGNAKGGWKGADHNYAVCCNGNTEGRSGEGNHGYLASTFENPKTTKVGNAKYYWDVRANNRKPLKDCKAGEIVANAKTRKYAFDRTCRACPSGQYTETKNGEACSACPVCAAGTFETKQCSGASKSVCQKCGTCSKGSYERSPCNTKTDTQCAKCSSCPSGTFLLLPCTPKSDSVCFAQTKCDAKNEYTFKAGTSSTNTKCLPLTKCSVDEFEFSPPGVDKDRKCKGFKVCNGVTEILKQVGNPTRDTVCTPVNKCDASKGQFESKAATLTTQPECVEASLCGDGEYATKEPTVAAPNRGCTKHSPPCSKAQYETAAPTDSTDRKCGELCFLCAPGTHQTYPCDTELGYRTRCEACATCADTEIMTGPCTHLRDRTCSPKARENNDRVAGAKLYNRNGQAVIKSDTSVIVEAPKLVLFSKDGEDYDITGENMQMMDAQILESESANAYLRQQIDWLKKGEL